MLRFVLWVVEPFELSPCASFLYRVPLVEIEENDWSVAVEEVVEVVEVNILRKAGCCVERDKTQPEGYILRPGTLLELIAEPSVTRRK